MKNSFLMLLLMTATFAGSQTLPASRSLLRPRLVTLTLDPNSVTVLHLRPGYVSSLRMPEEVSSVVLGDPDGFKAEHAPVEPRLVFVKPLTLKPAQTNLLITTRTGRRVSLHLVSDGQSQENGDVDFLVEFDQPASFFIPTESPSRFVVADTVSLSASNEAAHEKSGQVSPIEQALLEQTKISVPDWQGKNLQVAIGQVHQVGDQMTVGYSVLNMSDHTIDLLPPQVELNGPQKRERRKAIKSEPVAVTDYKATLKHLAPGTRADGVVVFDRPNFKQSSEALVLRVARADEVDRPVLVSFRFTAPVEGETR